MTSDNERLPSAHDAARLLTHLAQARPRRRETIAPRQLPHALMLLQTFQSQRLSATHQDLLASPRYRPAAQFFLTDVYAPRDFSQRDADMQRFYEGVRKVLPERAISILADIVTLANLTNTLDNRLAQALVDELGVTDTITPRQYAAGYRLCDNEEERRYQIQLVVQIGRGIDHLVRMPLIGLSLRLAHAPAVLAGWAELQSFLERGFSAFKHMRGAEPFLTTVERRETAILERIFAGHDEPFEPGDAR
jgi:hypothetical protein